MNEEKPTKNQANPEDETSGSDWGFFIAKEEVGNKLNQEKSSTDSSVPKPNKEKIKLTDWIVAIFTIAIAVVGYWQWEAISGQLEEMKKGGKDTHELAVQAKNQADRTKELATLSEKSLRIDERAWISYGIETWQFGGIPPVDQPFIIRITLRNTGKTPARDVRTCPRVAAGSKSVTPNFKCEKYVFSGTLFPQAGTFSDIIVTNKFAKEDRDKILDGSHIVWAYGRVTYRDVFDVPHWFTFCYRLLPGGGYMVCDQYHDIDPN